MYNKLEAVREKGVAEKMIVSNDYVCARDKLLKAKQLFPSLDHIVPMLTVCDILSVSKSIIPGYGTDYYWVLQLLPSCSQHDVKYRCEKLVALLQPIKNKFPGTELALKLIHEASSVLSDRNKRLTFDTTRGCSWKDYESSCIKSEPVKYRALTASDRVSSGQNGSDEAGLPIYKIYPKKGEIWAMYQNWNTDFNNSGNENYECCIVEILSDFLEGEKMMVAKLEEVEGCLTFFQRQQLDGFDMARTVSKLEMFSFSHQIPAFRVPGIGQHGIPENSWHLEPNASPLNHDK